MNDREQNDPNLDASEKLRAALARSQARRIIVPAVVDEVVLRAARERLEGTGEPRKRGTPNGEAASGRPQGFSIAEWLRLVFDTAAVRGRGFAPLAAVAVTIVAAGVLVWLTVHPRAALRPEDLNADGQVDMLDAFALARELQQGRTPRPQLDLNGDGVVDDRDVEVLAARAVTLETGGHS